jgi:quinoprotein glucose dehydrogenase
MFLFLFRFTIGALGLSILLLSACNSNTPEEAIGEVFATDIDFDTTQVSVDLREGMKLDLWAPGPLINNAVALDFDHQGAAYVSVTSRRKSSDIDIRAHRDWIPEDLGLQSLEDTEAFHKRKLATELSEQNTWQEDFNEDGVHDYRDLMVQSETIRKIEDTDGDGRADVSQVFADGFNDMLTGVAAGILHQGQDVFLTAAPDVYRLRDKDGDGRADERAVISHGYGIHIAYAGHDMSGLVMGPDGKVYWSIGDMGLNVVDQTGKRWTYPHQGAVMRCNPDGSEFEVFAHGLRNPQELAFDAYGNLVSVDNDGDHPGEHERFVHLIEGSDSGWRIHWQFGKYEQPHEQYKPWMDEKLHVPHFPGQAAYLLPPLALAPDGPAGLAYNPGTALGEEWQNHFFGSYFKGSSAQSKVQAFSLQPKGASFEVVKQEDVVTGIVSTGLAWGPDGALYVNDWLDGYALKPVGRIWKLDVAQNAHPLRTQTQDLLREGMGERSVSEIRELLGHADMRVRMEAQFELVKRQESEALLKEAQGTGQIFGRLHAIWGLGQLMRQDVFTGEGMLALLQDEEVEIRAQTAKVLGEALYQAANSVLVEQLQDPDPRARFFAIEAVGKLGENSAFDPLISLLEEVGESDPHTRHALTLALSRLGMDTQLADLAQHPNRDVRLGAVVALRHSRSSGLSAFLQDADPLVATEAARAIHDDFSVPEALPALAEALERSDIENEAFLRRAINANLRLGQEENAYRLAEYASRPSAPLAMREEALWSLGYWNRELVLDRVEGRYRELPERNPAHGVAAFLANQPSMLQNRAPEIRAAAAEIAGYLQLNEVYPQLFVLTRDQKEAIPVRKAALISLVQLKGKQTAEALEAALSDRSLALRTEAQTLLGEIELPAETVVQLLTTVLQEASTAEKQKALSSLATLSHPQAESILTEWLDRLEKGTLETALQLDLILAIEKSSFSTLQERLSQYEASKDADDPLALYAESLAGGDADKGQRLFYRNNSAQCIRCHQVGEFGGAVGPNLTEIGSVLDQGQLLASLVDPSARLAPGYGTVLLDLRDGSKVVGILVEENGQAITLKTGEEELTIPLSEIANKKYAPSAMPSMQGILSKSEIRDLVAFLQTLQSPDL